MKRGKIEKIATKVVEKTFGKVLDRKSGAQLAGMLRKLTPMVGVLEMRRRVIAGIEDDFRKKLAANPNLTDDELMSEYVNEPEAMALFKDLDMTVEHLRVMVKEAKAK